MAVIALRVRAPPTLSPPPPPPVFLDGTAPPRGPMPGLLLAPGMTPKCASRSTACCCLVDCPSAKDWYTCRSASACSAASMSLSKSDLNSLPACCFFLPRRCRARPFNDPSRSFPVIENRAENAATPLRFVSATRTRHTAPWSWDISLASPPRLPLVAVAVFRDGFMVPGGRSIVHACIPLFLAHCEISTTRSSHPLYSSSFTYSTEWSSQSH